MIEKMTDDSETIALRATVIAGKRYADDLTVIWRALSIGRIMQASGVPAHLAQWPRTVSNGTDFSGSLSWCCFSTSRLRRGVLAVIPQVPLANHPYRPRRI
jgi:hypothetical protein